MPICPYSVNSKITPFAIDDAMNMSQWIYDWDLYIIHQYNWPAVDLGSFKYWNIDLERMCRDFKYDFFNDKQKQRSHVGHLEFQDGRQRLKIVPLHLLTPKTYIYTQKSCFYVI